MNSSPTITKIAAALVKAQSEMGNAVKGSDNPFFKKKYADLNSVREAALPALNKYGVTVLQPTIVIDGINYVETILMHESGEFISGVTQIITDKPNDAQRHGSGLSYARRYGFQSIVNIGAEDDDANSISGKDLTETPAQIAIGNARLMMSVEELEGFWKSQTPEIQKDKSFIAAVKARKNQLTKQQ